MIKILKVTAMIYALTFLILIILFNILSIPEHEEVIILMWSVVILNAIAALVLPRIYKDRK